MLGTMLGTTENFASDHQYESVVGPNTIPNISVIYHDKIRYVKGKARKAQTLE